MWRSAISANSYATFSVDGTSWPIAIGILTLGFSALLAAPARERRPSTVNSILVLIATALGVLAVASDGPLTLVLFWAGLDLAQAGMTLGRTDDAPDPSALALTYGARLASIAFMLLGLILGQADPSITGFASTVAPGTLLLQSAAMVRLAAFAVPGSLRSDPRGDRMGSTTELMAGASAVALLSRLGPSVGPSGLALNLVAGAMALYGGWMWLRAPERELAPPMWILCTGSLAVAASLRGSPGGVTGWACAMLLAGGALFLMARPEEPMKWMLLSGLWICSALPLTITASASTGASPTANILLPVFILAQALLLAGFLHWTLRPSMYTAVPADTPSLSWVYRGGLALPLVCGIILGIWGWPGALQMGLPFVAGIVILMTVAASLAKRRMGRLNPSLANWTPSTLVWIAAAVKRWLAGGGRALQWMALGMTRAMEGEAGIMWSFLLLVLFVALVSR
jgi:hypothetical protein